MQEVVGMDLRYTLMQVVIGMKETTQEYELKISCFAA